jgi:hypothetical protein
MLNYFVGYQLQLFNNFDGFVTFPPPIGDQFVQQDRRKIYGGNVSYMVPGNIFGFDSQDTIGIQARTDDIHVDLAETRNDRPGSEAHGARRPCDRIERRHLC